MTDKREDECYSESCNDKCTRIVYWPGKNPPPKYCKKHAIKAIKLSDAMGLSVYWKEIEKEGE